jgi:hypothetical protein
MSGSHAGSAPPKPIVPLVRHLSIEYLGFRSVKDRREYLLCAKLGTESCEYTVWIPNSAFAAGRALFQDGPDICYQRLRRELAGAELTGGRSFEVTESELVEYRVSHAPPQRRSASPTPGAPKTTSSEFPPHGRG